MYENPNPYYNKLITLKLQKLRYMETAKIVYNSYTDHKRSQLPSLIFLLKLTKFPSAPPELPQSKVITLYFFFSFKQNAQYQISGRKGMEFHSGENQNDVNGFF